MSSFYWLKLWHEMLDDPKVARLNDSAYRRFIECLLLAGELDQDGFLPELEDMAWRLRIGEADLAKDLSRLALSGLVELKTADGADRWYVTNFARRQRGMSDAERKQRQRERDRKKQYHVTEQSRTGHEDVTPRDTDKDKDRDKDRDKDKEGKRPQTYSAPIVGPILNPKNAVDARTMAIGQVCQYDLRIPKHRAMAEQAAAQLFKFTADEILSRYGQPDGGGGWNWYKHDWRGKKQQPDPPTPRTIIETITLRPPPEPVRPQEQETAAERLQRLGIGQ